MPKLVPFQPPPGVWANGTPYEAKGRWSDSNLVRWRNGRLQPLGGWEETNNPIHLFPLCINKKQMRNTLAVILLKILISNFFISIVFQADDIFFGECLN